MTAQRSKTLPPLHDPTQINLQINLQISLMIGDTKAEGGELPKI